MLPPRVDADSLFLPSTTVAAPADTSFEMDGHGWDLKGRPTLRARDLLKDPEEAPTAATEVSFFAPVTPEQLGEDPKSPAP